MSLRLRLILTFALVVFLCLFITATVAALLLQGTRDTTALNRLEDTARPLYLQFRSVASGQNRLAELWQDIQEQAQSNNIYIILSDSSGNVLRQATPRRALPPLDIPSGALPHSIKNQDSGIFETASGLKFLYIAYPLSSAATQTSATQRVDTLMIAKPRSSAIAVWATLIRPFFWAALISLVISIVLAVFLARSIYRPIQHLVRGAENVAQGKYGETIPLEGPGELKELALSFNDMSAKVEHAQQQQRHFVADVSHQLRSPLTSIQGFAQAMLDGTVNDEETRKKSTQIIVDESRRMIRQVNQLLELSRLQAGQVKMETRTVDMKELLSYCQETFALRMQEKSLRLKVHIEALPPVSGDSDRLEDVFSNLLDNAVKNTPAHGEIQVMARSLNHKVEIVIADSGPGIPPEQLPFVFQRFQQGDAARSGTGLGLAIAREIILAHHGEIQAVSNPGEGARFIVTLPTNLV